MHKNTCPAFFTDATINSAGAYSPCTALGGAGWNFSNQTFKVTWLDPALNLARQQSKDGFKLDMCNRCWSEEAVGLTSEREYLIKDLPEGLDYSNPSYYLSGPRHLNIKVSNICNLRCRTCQSSDSYLYHIEGEYYQNKYKGKLAHTVYTLEKFKKRFTDEQLDELYEFSGNLERIELYGGEPLLDEQIPKFLMRLVGAGRSKDIDLFVSTNCTHEITDEWLTIFKNFKQCTINLSVDGIANKFTYMRHPGKWDVVQKNLDYMFDVVRNCNERPVWLVPVITVSALNVYNVNDVFEYFKRYDVTPFIILAQTPFYYSVNVLPDEIKPLVAEHLNSFNNPQFDAIINLMNTEPVLTQGMHLDTPWEQFKFWTKEKDLYRNEDFLETFIELGRLLVKHNKW